MDPILKIPKPLYAQIKAHALDSAPYECCGVIAVEGDMAVKVFQAPNTHKNPLNGYRIDTSDHLSIIDEIGNKGWQVGAIYHSHPFAEPVLSQKDIDLASPLVLQVIVGMGKGLVTKAYKIQNQWVEEIGIQIV